MSGSTGMQIETEGAAVDLACSQLDKTANGWIERTACNVARQPRGVAVGVWIGAIGVEAHHPDGMPGDKSVGGMPMTSRLPTGNGNRRFRARLLWLPGLFDWCRTGPASRRTGHPQSPRSMLQSGQFLDALGGPVWRVWRRGDIPEKRRSCAENRPSPWPLVSSFGVGRRRGTVLGSRGLRVIESFGVVSGGLGPRCQLPTVRLQHRPAGHRISLRLDKGLYDCGEFPEDPYRKRATDPNSDHILQRSVAFDSFHGTYGSGFG